MKVQNEIEVSSRNPSLQEIFRRCRVDSWSFQQCSASRSPRDSSRHREPLPASPRTDAAPRALSTPVLALHLLPAPCPSFVQPTLLHLPGEKGTREGGRKVFKTAEVVQGSIQSLELDVSTSRSA